MSSIDTARPFEVSREDFASAVAAGIAAALDKGAPLSAAQRLRDVAREDTLVGLNYEGCPLTLAGLYQQWEKSRKDSKGMPEWAREFVRTYDDAICALGAFSVPSSAFDRRGATCLIIQD
jgi:hypothetical protein